MIDTSKTLKPKDAPLSVEAHKANMLYYEKLANVAYNQLVTASNQMMVSHECYLEEYNKLNKV